MKNITLQQVISAVNGTFRGDEALLSRTVSDVSIDSRTITENALFVAIKGDRFDGHSFISDVLAKGALAAISSQPMDGNIILVEDTLEAYQKLAAYYRSLFDIPFVGITGSVGKTTTKELVSTVLSQRFNTHKNVGNLNNQTGVPQTLFKLEEKHEAAVIEMGTNHFGEIDSLAKMVQPNICIITNIGESHIEFLGSKEGILKAKSEMFAHRKPNGKIIVNGNDPLLRTLIGKYPELITYGIGSECDVYATDLKENALEGTHFTAHFNGTTADLFVPAPGEYMVQNALCALAAGLSLGMDIQAIKEGIAAFQPTAGRMHIIKKQDLTIINDAYNANPTSMSASIKTVCALDGRSVLILGDMFELGEKELDYHRQMGEFAAAQKADLLLCVGKLTFEMYMGAMAKGCRTMYFANKDILLRELPELLEDGDTVLIKASHSMRLDEVAAWLDENFE